MSHMIISQLFMVLHLENPLYIRLTLLNIRSYESCIQESIQYVYHAPDAWIDSVTCKHHCT